MSKLETPPLIFLDGDEVAGRHDGHYDTAVFMFTLFSTWYVVGTQEVLVPLPAPLWIPFPSGSSVRHLLN